MNIERVRVGDVLRLERRPVSVELDATYQEIGVRSFGRGLFHKEPVLGAQLGSKRVFRIEPGDLVISNVFAWEGAIAVASPAEEDKVGSHRFMTFVPVSGRIDVAWAAWFFRSELGLELIRKASPGSAGRNRTLAIDRFEALEIPLPQIDEQRRVAGRLERMAAAVAEVQRRSSRTSELAKALTGSISARPDLDSVAKAGAGWREVSLGEILHLNSHEVRVEPDSAYKVAGVFSFGRGMFARSTVDGSQIRYKTLHRLQAGQLVMSRLKAWEGALALVPPELDGWFVSPEFPAFDVDAGRVDPLFLEAVVCSKPFWDRLRGFSQGIGARRERVSATRLMEQQVELPSIDEQRSAAETLAQVSAIRARAPQVETRVSSLLPAALNEAFAGLT